MKKTIFKRIEAISLCFLLSFSVLCSSISVNKTLTAKAAITQEQQIFINNLGNAAQKNYSKYRILPSMTVAQAILESNWGKSSLSALYYNFFGMKAGSSYKGETVDLKTGEEVNGVLINVTGKFRVYHSFDEGIEGYYQFITGISRYSNLIGETNYKEACRKIKEDGWATDSQYTTKLISIIETYNLTKFDTDVPIPPVTEGCFPPCGSSYTSIVEALDSINVDSSYAYREKIAAANDITNYSGTAEQNTTMLNKLKSGSLRIPTEDTVIPAPPVVDITEAYFPACSSSFTSLVDALKSIGVNSSYDYRKTIAIANGISDYSGTAEQNTKLLTLLKAGKLINPDGKTITPDISGKYYPACDSSYTSLADALKSIGEDGSYAHRKEIAIANGISDYSGTADQNISLLTLLKNGKLIKSDYVAPPPIVDYIVTLDANKGTAPIAFMTIASNSVYNGLPTASREGYTFTGWYTTANGGKKITDGMSLVSASNHTIYANWTANKYVVTLNNNDGTGLSSQKTVTCDTAYGDLVAPTRSGYTFIGWYTDIIGGTKISSSTIHNVADNRTLYANWTPNKYSVSFDLNGGSGSFSAISVEYDGIYGDLPIPERAGYNFIGWFNAAENGVQISQNSRVEITSNQILYARWQQIVTTTTSTTTSTTSTMTTSTTTTTTTTAPVVTIKPDDVINDDDTAIIISDVNAEVGETVDISIDISNNPGIASLGFELSYDPECVEFIDSVNGTIMGESYFECVNNPKNNIIFVQWINFENDITESGTILVLTFKVLDDVTSDSTKIGISCKNDDIKNLEDQIIPVKIKSGNITIGSENNIAGDANDDEVIDLKDVIIIRRYIAGGWDININAENADVNNDDKIDLKDVILIRRYIAGGWDIELV